MVPARRREIRTELAISGIIPYGIPMVPEFLVHVRTEALSPQKEYCLPGNLNGRFGPEALALEKLSYIYGGVPYQSDLM